MAESISIVMKMTDDISSTMKSIASSSTGVSKQFEDLQRKAQQLGQRYTALNKEAAKTATQATEVKKELSEAAKQFKKTGDEADKVRLEELTEKFNDLTDASKGYRNAARETIKEMNAISQAARKLEDESGGEGSSFFSSFFSGSLASGLAKSGIIKDAGASISGYLGAQIESAVGQPLATTISESLSGTISGVAAGAIAGVPGMIIGGLVGTAAGYLNAETQTFEAKDDAFKSYVQEAYENQLQDSDESLTSGSTTAGSREQTQMAFSQRFGSDEAATAFLDDVKETARNTNYGYDEIAEYSKLLLNSYNQNEVFSVLQSLSDATAGLSLQSSDVSMMIAGLSRMRTTGKATQEYLNYFTERGVDTYQALANATGADKAEIAEMVTGGEISGEDAAQAILDYINETYGGLSDKLAATYDAMVDNLEDFQTDMDAAMGEGYNEARKAGLQAQMDWMSGESGAAIEEANRAIGAWKAELENQKEQYIREAMDAMMASDAYQTAAETGDAAEMGRLIMQAKVDGMNQYNASEGAQLALESEKALITGIRKDAALNDEYWQAGYDLGNEFTKGLAAARSAGQFISQFSPYYYDAMLDDPYIANAWNSHAYGLRRVPYDGYPAILHQDEAVLTAEEARRKDSDGIVVTVTGNDFYVRDDSDIDLIATALAEKLQTACVAYGG